MTRQELITMVESYLSTQDDMHELAGYIEGLIDKASRSGHIQGYRRGVFQSDWVRRHIKDAQAEECDAPSILNYLADRDFDVWQKEQQQSKS